MNQKQLEKAYVLLSGGQDSFVCLLWALQNFKTVETVSIDYGQSHGRELHYAVEIARHFKVKHTVYDIGDFFKTMTISSLFGDGEHQQNHKLAGNLPASFVPNRNGIFFTIASNHAYKNHEKRINLISGVCETDYSGYPDCRDNYIKAKQIELSLGLDRPVSIFTPLMWKTKAQTFELAQEAGKLKELIEFTLTCYNGNEELHDWGRGCGNCPSCLLRRNGYQEFLHNSETQAS
jgi:7-cyano-7-deazaguanine synthase